MKSDDTSARVLVLNLISISFCNAGKASALRRPGADNGTYIQFTLKIVLYELFQIELIEINSFSLVSLRN